MKVVPSLKAIFLGNIWMVLTELKIRVQSPKYKLSNLLQGTVP
jgi:hypothetical protein